MSAAAVLAALALGVAAATVAGAAGRWALDAHGDRDGEAAFIAGFLLALALLLLAGALAIGSLA